MKKNLNFHARFFSLGGGGVDIYWGENKKNHFILTNFCQYCQARLPIVSIHGLNNMWFSRQVATAG